MGLLYTKTKIFHFKEKLDSLPKAVEKIFAPIHIRIKPTNLCCHSCKYCAYGEKNLKIFGKDEVKKTFIPKKKMMEIIQDAIGMEVKAITFSGGGEPFLYPHFLDVVKCLSDSLIQFSSLSNGSLLHGDIARIFALNGSWLRISLDGWDDESYSAYRGVRRGEFTKVMNNMKAFKDFNGKCYLGVSLIVDNKNSAHIYEIIKQLKGAGVNSVKISPCLVNDNAKDNNAFHKGFFKKVKEEVKNAIKDFSNEGFEIFDAYAVLEEKFDKDYDWCPYLQILPIIGADLNVYACPDKAYNTRDGILGTIKDKSFKEFWFSDKNKFFKIDPSNHCRHHCETNQKNRIVLEYLNADKDHLNFV